MKKFATTKKIVVILLAGMLLPACGDTHESSHNEGVGEAVTSSIEVDDVPSLHLPAEQRDPAKLWCTEHSRYEEECYICHPELMPKESADFDIDDVPSLNLPEAQRESGKLWCTEHSRYEEECYICHPELIPTHRELG